MNYRVVVPEFTISPTTYVNFAGQKREVPSQIVIFVFHELSLILDADPFVRLRSTYIMAANGRIDPNSHYPSAADAGKSMTQDDFKITTRKLPIL